jgi:hypothetical protein
MLPQASITIWPGSGDCPHLAHPRRFAGCLAATAWWRGAYGSFGADLRLPGIAGLTLGGGLGYLDRIYGAARLPNFLRKPYGPGWALVGDAGSHKDPVRALGICDALLDAELLADSLTATLSGGQAEGVALSAYERRRNEATMDDYEANLRAARFSPPTPEILQARAAARDDPHAMAQFCLAWEGRISRRTSAAELYKRARARECHITRNCTGLVPSIRAGSRILSSAGTPRPSRPARRRRRAWCRRGAVPGCRRRAPGRRPATTGRTRTTSTCGRARGTAA